MEFRLLIDLEVLEALTKTTRQRLMGHFGEIRSFRASIPITTSKTRLVDGSRSLYGGMGDSLL